MQTTTANRRSRWVFHPFLFALFPPLSLLSANLAWVEVPEFLLPACAVLGIAAVLWVALWPVLPDAHKRGVALSLLWPPFYGYGYLLDRVRALLQNHEQLGLAHVMLSCAALAGSFALLLYVLRRTPANFEKATRALNSMSLLLIVVAAASCGFGLIRQSLHQMPEAALSSKALAPEAPQGGLAQYLFPAL